LAVYGPGTPYVSPQLLTNAPTGITWKTIPTPRATAAEQYAEQVNICARATSMVDTACNQVLRATVDTETQYGPDYYLTLSNSTFVGRMVLQRWPVIQVISGQWNSTATFPPDWQPIPGSQFAIERPIIGLYGTSAPSDAGDGGQAVLIAPGYLTWAYGRRGIAIQVTYVNGWPHTSLTVAATAGSSVIQVDDCTGWAPVTPGGQGATGVIKDASDQEAVTVTASSVTQGPGYLTLASPLGFGHGAGVLLTTLPEQIQQATILFAASQALVRGATATTIQTIAGTGEATASGHDQLEANARALCLPYKRTWLWTACRRPQSLLTFSPLVTSSMCPGLQQRSCKHRWSTVKPAGICSLVTTS